MTIQQLYYDFGYKVDKSHKLSMATVKMLDTSDIIGKTVIVDNRDDLKYLHKFIGQRRITIDVTNLPDMSHDDHEYIDDWPKLGNLECLINRYQLSFSYGCRVLHIIVRYGHIHVLDYMYNQPHKRPDNYSIFMMYIHAVRYEDSSVLEWIEKRFGHVVDAGIIRSAIAFGKYINVVWLLNRKFTFNNSGLKTAVEGGHYHIYLLLQAYKDLLIGDEEQIPLEVCKMRYGGLSLLTLENIEITQKMYVRAVKYGVVDVVRARRDLWNNKCNKKAIVRREYHLVDVETLRLKRAKGDTVRWLKNEHPELYYLNK